MIIEARFKQALKAMMNEMPLGDINVTLLCKKCDCHRQTFYYHYQDIYDLVAAIFLSEKIVQVEKANTIKDLLLGFTQYCKENFSFLKSTFDSAANDLAEDFIYGKIMVKIFNILTSSKYNLDSQISRPVSRRFSRLVSEEIKYLFKERDITIEKFEKVFTQFIVNSTEIVLPSLIEMSKKESK